MDKHLHNIDNLFKNAIDEHEETPSVKVWDAIDSKLDKSNVVSINKKYNNLKRIVIALLILLLCTITYQILNKKNIENETTLKNEIKNNKTIYSPQKNNELNANSNIKHEVENKQLNIKPNILDSALIAKKYANVLSVHNAYVDTVSKDKEKIKEDNVFKINKNKLNCNYEIKGIVNKKFNKKNNNSNIIANNNLLNNEVDNLSPIALKSKIDTSSLSLLDFDKIKIIKNGFDIEKFNLMSITQNKNFIEFEEKSKPIGNIKKIKTKPFQISVIPFYGKQFNKNRIEDDIHTNNSGMLPPQRGSDKDGIKDNEKHPVATNFGIAFQIPINKMWGIQTGLNYLSKQIEIEPKEIFAKMDNDGKVKFRFDCSSGYTFLTSKNIIAPVVGDSIKVSASENSLQYLGLPIAINYNFNVGKFSILPTIGTQINFLTKQKIETSLEHGNNNEKEVVTKIDGLKPIYFNAITAIAFEYKSNKNISLNMMPSGNFAIGAINKNATVKSYPNSFSITAGLKFKL